MNDDKEVKIESVSVDDVNTVETPENTSNEPTELEKMTAQLAEMNDKYLRLAAELENTRRRS
ncbi:MAG: nucleotide exchange factor GrpE, partial [Alphaproteobacteria bacterium]|nr:nucleotide exchange factor GrpE [Alphaproteobacteria bacterium]